MYQEEQEYRAPIKILTNRDPVIRDLLSIRELVQWIAVLILVYLEFHLPMPLQLKLGLIGLSGMAGFVFIHVPVNGLSGLEWLFIRFVWWREKKLHQAKGVEPANGNERLELRPAFRVELRLDASTLPASLITVEEAETETPTGPGKQAVLETSRPTPASAGSRNPLESLIDTEEI